jgi:hypothetical protein
MWRHQGWYSGFLQRVGLQYVCPNVSEELDAPTFNVTDFDLSGCISNLEENMSFILEDFKGYSQTDHPEDGGSTFLRNVEKFYYCTWYNNAEVRFL